MMILEHDLKPDEIVYIVMSGSVNEKTRSVAIRQSWAENIRDNVILVSDRETDDLSILSMTLPVLIKPSLNFD
jgi:fructose-1-phosphate kinase PfkB-like protein